MRKSEWGGVHVASDSSQSACKSWFAGMISDDDKVLKANILERLSDGKELKLRVLVERADGTQKEFVRSRTASGFTITRKPPSTLPWA